MSKCQNKNCNKEAVLIHKGLKIQLCRPCSLLLSSTFNNKQYKTDETKLRNFEKIK